MDESGRSIKLETSEKRKTFSKCQWWLNWITVIFLQVLISVTYGVVIPSLHQFVTNNVDNDDNGISKTPEKNLTSNESTNKPTVLYSQILIWPGLAQSELVYSWVVASYSIGELIGAFIGGILSSFLSYRFNIFFVNIILIIGGSLYALTVHATMIMTARLFMGIHCGYGLVLLTSYIGITTDQLEEEKLATSSSMARELKEEKQVTNSKLPWCCKRRRKNTTLKDWLYGIYSLTVVVSYPFTLGVCAIMSSFSHLNPFHWPGWFVVAMTTTYLVVFTLLFREATPLFSRPTIKKKFKPARKSCPKCEKIVMYSILTVASFMTGSLCAPFDVLMNPVLGDQFGFRISDMSYFILALLSMMIISVIFQFVVKVLSVPNRAVLIIVFVVAIAGGLLVSDWQSIGDDSCDLNESELYVRSDLELNSTASSLQNDTSYLEQLCLAQSNNISHSQCYWNPRSRITGHFCGDCYPICRNIPKSLNFAQFFIGLSLIVCAIPLGQVFVSVVTSDYTPLEYQGVMMGAIFGAAGLARFVTPMFVDWTYEATDKHTIVPMSVMNFAWLMIVVMLLMVYKQLAPKTETKSIKKDNNYTTLTSESSINSTKSCELDINLNLNGYITTSQPAMHEEGEHINSTLEAGEKGPKPTICATVERSSVSVNGNCITDNEDYRDGSDEQLQEVNGDTEELLMSAM